MVSLVQPRALDFADALPDSARSMIRQQLDDEPTATRKIYAALARKVWSLLIERRFDDEIRDWHSLLHAVKAHVRETDDAAAERVTALADMLRESISLAESSPAREIADRPRARRILEALQHESGFVPRRVLMESLGMTSSHLSNVLTKLVAHNLIDRRDKGKEAEFRLTALGRQLLSGNAFSKTTDELSAPVYADTVIERLRSVPAFEAQSHVFAVRVNGFIPTLQSDHADYGPTDLAKVFDSGRLASRHLVPPGGRIETGRKYGRLVAAD